MEWIEKTKEAVRIAMNKGKSICAYHDKVTDAIGFCIEIKTDYNISINFDCQKISIHTHKGYMHIDYNLTDRDKLELQALVLSVKEYKEDMAISEFDEFIYENQKDTPKNIDELDDEEE